jgi:phosphatidylserine decarboxylase
VFVFLQRLLPKHLLSRLVGFVAASEVNLVKSAFIRIFCHFYTIDLSEAERESPKDYRSFNDFFTRALKPGARGISGDVCSPADGTVAALGHLSGDTIIQSKSHNYSVNTLLADNTDEFSGGSFITIYLAPHNYHRVHVPCDGTLLKATYVPGDLFSVNQVTANQLPGLFARNERLVCRFSRTEGNMAVVMVGAMLVAGIKPTWAEKPFKPRLQVNIEMKQTFRQGEELGQFMMGSTVILLFPERLDFTVAEGDLVSMGQAIA